MNQKIWKKVLQKTWTELKRLGANRIMTEKIFKNIIDENRKKYGKKAKSIHP